MASDDDLILTQLAQLQSDVEQLVALRGRVRDLSAVTANLGVKVDALAAAVADVAHAPQRGAGPVWCWPDLDADAAQQAWTTLTTWMREYLLDRYPLARRAVYPCWYRHPEAVDALSALFATWQTAYHDASADSDRAASWLERWLPAALRQLNEALHSCTRKEHTVPGPHGELVDGVLGAGLREAIAADVAHRPMREV